MYEPTKFNLEANGWLFTPKILCIVSLIPAWLLLSLYTANMEIYRQLKFGTFCCIHNQIYIIHL